MELALANGMMSIVKISKGLKNIWAQKLALLCLSETRRCPGLVMQDPGVVISASKPCEKSHLADGRLPADARVTPAQISRTGWLSPTQIANSQNHQLSCYCLKALVLGGVP